MKQLISDILAVIIAIIAATLFMPYVLILIACGVIWWIVQRIQDNVHKRSKSVYCISRVKKEMEDKWIN